jgi:hypothetical protein
VRVLPTLQVPGRPEVFSIGDVAATDPIRSSARNRADRMLAANIRAQLAGKPMRSFEPPRSRWGSVLGPQADGLQVFAPSGHPFRFPAWSVRRVLRPWIVRRGIYKGIRGESAAAAAASSANQATRSGSSDSGRAAPDGAFQNAPENSDPGPA